MADDKDNSALEAEFDDLLGDFGGTTNGVMENGDVRTSTTTVTTESSDGVMSTTTTKKTVTESHTEEEDDRLQWHDRSPSPVAMVTSSEEPTNGNSGQDANTFTSHTDDYSESPPPSELLHSQADAFGEELQDYDDFHEKAAPRAETEEDVTEGDLSPENKIFESERVVEEEQDDDDDGGYVEDDADARYIPQEEGRYSPEQEERYSPQQEVRHSPQQEVRYSPEDEEEQRYSPEEEEDEQPRYQEQFKPEEYEERDNTKMEDDDYDSPMEEVVPRAAVAEEYTEDRYDSEPEEGKEGQVRSTTSPVANKEEAAYEYEEQYERDSSPEPEPSRPARFEDTLPDYQASRHYTKTEVDEPKAAPGVYITDSDKVDQAEPEELEAEEKIPEKEERKVPRKATAVDDGNLIMTGAGKDALCRLCQKRVYEMEKIIADKNIYHKTCFKCNHCRRVLSLGNFATLEGNIYCKPHFMEIFKLKGRYATESAEQLESQLNGMMGNSEAQPLGDREQNDDTVYREDQNEIPNIGNIKSRFDSESPVNGVSHGDDDDIVRETQEKEEVRFTQMSSVRNMFEKSTSQEDVAYQPPPPASKKASKWDAPKNTPPPPVVNRQYSDDEGEGQAEEPSSASTRNLVDKFREFGDEDTAPAKRKGMRKITPPREELAESIEESRRYNEEREQQRDPEVVRGGSGDDGGGFKEEELPPVAITRSLVSKFRDMETSDPYVAPPSPQRNTTPKSKTTMVARTSTRMSPDSGISDYDMVNGGTKREDVMDGRAASPEPEGGVYENEPVHSPDVVRENDHTQEEQELPERGTTRSLLAQWKQKEQDSGSFSPELYKPRKTSATSRSWASPSSTHQEPPADVVRASDPAPDQVDMAEGGVYENQPAVNSELVRETDTNEEECLPPPRTTKNMLAKFRNLEAESSQQDTSPRSGGQKKQFKWEVKSASTLSRPLDNSFDHPKDTNRSLSSPDGYHSDDHDDVAADIVHSDIPQEDEVPSPEHTRSILAKFQSMEDDTYTPPSPQYSAQLQRAAHVTPSSVRKMGVGDVGGGDHAYDDEQREQPEGGEYENGHYDEYNHDNHQHHYEDVEEGEYENEPVRYEGVLREEDHENEEAELPEQGTTRNLLAKFQSMQSY